MDPSTRRLVHDTMVRLADGDRSAFPTLFEVLWPALLAFARRALGGSADAEDVAQQTLFKICFRVSEFDTSRDGAAWAFGIAAWEIRTHRQKVRRRHEVSDQPLSNLPSTMLNHEALMVERDLHDTLVDVLGELSERDRALLLPSDPDACTSPKSPTHRKRRQRALARLRALWTMRRE